ncbi:MAG: hypothetical protein RLZZ297_1233 [Chloroflexota bacterium]|jgi:energy-coupling factor transport system permease protein
MPAYDALHPLTKLTWAVVCITAAYLSVTLMPATAACLGALVPVVWSAQRNKILRLLPWLILPITFSVLLFRVVLFPDVMGDPIDVAGYTLGRAALTQGIVIVLRYTTLSTAFLAVFQTTPTAQLTQALAEKGMPRSIEFILLMALQIIPDMQQRAHDILEAQQSRGLVIDTPIRRVQSLIPLVGPLVVGALVDVEERGMALELRAYGATNRPTRLLHLVDTPVQHVLRTVLLCATAVLIGLVVVRGTML